MSNASLYEVIGQLENLFSKLKELAWLEVSLKDKLKFMKK